MPRPATQSTPPDPLFPSGYFARVPNEMLSPLAHRGDAAMSHAEFRVVVALLRYRGRDRLVFPTRETLEMMTGMTKNNLSRATRSLVRKGWLTIHYEGATKHRKVTNYELHLPGAQPVVRPDSSANSQVAKRAVAQPAVVQPRHEAEPQTLEDVLGEFGPEEDDDCYLYTDDELDAMAAEYADDVESPPPRRTSRDWTGRQIEMDLAPGD